jgi:hypothetical protein
MQRDKALYYLRQTGLIPDGMNIMYSLNRVKFSSKISEGLKHAVVKSILARLIIKQGDSVLTEFTTRQGRRFDVLQLKEIKGKAKTKCNLIVYEFEATSEVKEEIKGIDTITIKLNSMPDDIYGIEKYLIEKVII